jgi:hypothetical protein
MKIPLLCLLLAIVTWGCNQSSKKEAQISSRSNLLTKASILDTGKVIAQLHIMETRSRMDLTSEKVDLLSNKLDTLYLTYYFPFCDCQSWVLSDTHARALKENPELDAPDPRGQIEFNADKTYYIEEANSEVEFDGRAAVSGTTVRFIGRLYTEKRLPLNGGFVDPNPPPGKVFRYYSYKIIRPYKVYGPERFIEVDSLSHDSLKDPTVLTVKK